MPGAASRPPDSQIRDTDLLTYFSCSQTRDTDLLTYFS